MIWKKTLLSLFFFLLLVGLYVADRRWVEYRRATKELSERAFPLKKEDVTEMTLVTPKEIITVKRGKGDRWTMTQPLQTAADKDTIEIILGNLVPALRYGEFKADAGVKLEAYGLSAPDYKLILKTKDAKAMTLLVGSQAPESGKFYAKLEHEDRIFSINEYTKNKLEKKPFDLRDRSVLLLSVDGVRRVVMSRQIKLPIEIKSPDQGTTATTVGWQTPPPEKIVLAKDAGGNWQIEDKATRKGDAVEIENLLRKLNTEKVTAFVDTPTTGATYGFDNPQVNLQIEQIARAGDGGTTGTTQTQTLTLLVGDRETSPSKDFYAKRGDGTTMKIGQPLFDALAIKATKFRDKQLFTLASSGVGYFEIRAGKSTVRLNRNEQGRWLFSDDRATSVDQEIVRSKVSSLVNLRAKDYETDEPGDLAQYKLDKPFVRLTVADSERKTTETLEMGDLATRDGESVVFARVGKAKTIALLDFRQPKEFALTRDQLIDKTLYQFDPRAIVRVEVRTDATTFTLARDGEAWRMQRPKAEEQRRVSTFWAEDIARGLRYVKYSDVYKGNLTEQEMGLTSPTLQVVLFDRENAEVARLVRGKEKGERYYAKSRADGPVYGVQKTDFRPIESAIDNLLKD